MILLLRFLLLQWLILFSNAQFRYKKFQKLLQEPKRPLLPLMGPKIQKLRSVQICYDSVGCFDIPRHHNPFQKVPEHPEILETRFLLFCRNLNFSTPQLLSYNELKSLENSKFDPKIPVKIIVHGYMTKWNEVGALAGAQAYLDISPCNVILVDWEKGAKGPSYSSAAANTELVGRQLGLLLLRLASLGAHPSSIHIVGFSLGAHVAACAAEVVKRHGMKIGRITGLDPASPLFKLNHFRDNKKKLDISDADFVDVVHTDGSPIFTDGFGILEPIGHVDFFPNGGREQPGCNDIRNAVVKSHFDKNLDRQIACSHIRAYHYFLETLLENAKGSKSSGCRFVAFSCPGGPGDFALGRCFPADAVNLSGNSFQDGIGILGEDSVGKGIMYLVTRGAAPFCGMQMQIIISISPETRRTKGLLSINFNNGNVSTDFSIICDLLDFPTQNRKIFGIFSANFDNFSRNVQNITLNIVFNRPHLPENKNRIFLDKITVKSMDGQSWNHCGNSVIQQNIIFSRNITKIIC